MCELLRYYCCLCACQLLLYDVMILCEKFRGCNVPSAPMNKSNDDKKHNCKVLFDC